MVKTSRERHLWEKYEMTEADVESLSASQDGRCAICGRFEADIPKGLCIDHCHRTGRVRGLLCTACNTHLGWAERWTTAINKYLTGYTPFGKIQIPIKEASQ